jgi:ABC-type transport system involved in cytochrome c biogenesis permease component
VRWLLVKDLQVLRRSPMLVGLLIIYPITLALMIGFALSSPPGKPKVAVFDEVASGQGRLMLGGQRVDVGGYASKLYQSIDRLSVSSRAQALADVRDGKALAGLVVPADIVSQIHSLVSTGVGNPTVELILNTNDPLERQFVEQAISSRVAEVEQAVSKQVLHVALGDLQLTLSGGTLHLLGRAVNLLGLRDARAIVGGVRTSPPPRSPLRAALGQVIAFAKLAIDGFDFASPVLQSIGSPLTVVSTQLAGRTTPVHTYAAAISVDVSLMFLTMLLAAAMLAIERSENVYSRLVRGLVPPGALLSEKVALSAGCAGAVTLLMSAFVSLFVHLDWARIPLWLLTLAVGGLAFGALGVAIGGLAREVSVASLLAFLISLPVAFVALVPSNAVSGGLKSVLDAIAFVFPFKPTLQALSNAFSAAGPGVGWPLVHLAVLTLVFLALGRLALRRFA